VFAGYGDDVVVPDQPGSVILSVPNAAVTMVQSGIPSPMMLVGNWREQNKETILRGEAGRRILDVFPEHSQRNASFELQSYILEYGADSSLWPTDEQARKTEIERCVDYIHDVRERCNQYIGSKMPTDPTADENWPARINAYQPLTPD
jgi:hypothetical protein